MLTYEIKNGHAVVTGWDASRPVEELVYIEIPPKYNFFRVTEIAPKAFTGCPVEGVLLPGSITTIGDSAFLCSSLRWIGCGSRLEDKENGISCVAVQTIGKRAFCDTALEDVILQTPDSRLEVGEYAFADGRQLRNVVFQTADRVKLGKGCFSKSGIQTAVLPRNGALEAISEECFLGCVQLRSVSFRDVRSIGKNAFLGCKELRYLSSMDGLEAIADSAFNLCSSLKEVTLPDSCVQYATNAFQSAGIEAFAVDPQNPMFYSENGVIFSKDKTRLLSFPPARGGSFSIPEGIVAVGEHAFHDSNLSNINFSSTVRVIEARAFDGADNLTDLYLPDSLSFLGEDAFLHCHKLYSVSIPSKLKLDWEDSFYGLHLREVHYRGSKADFKKQISGDLVNENASFFFEDAYGQEYKEAICRRRTLQFEYTVYPDGIRIDKVFSILSKVVVPEMMEVDGENYFVTEIGYAAFPDCQEIYIPETVREAPEAVAGCMFLRKLTIPVDLWIEPATIPESCIVHRY